MYWISLCCVFQINKNSLLLGPKRGVLAKKKFGNYCTTAPTSAGCKYRVSDHSCTVGYAWLPWKVLARHKSWASSHSNQVWQSCLGFPSIYFLINEHFCSYLKAMFQISDRDTRYILKQGTREKNYFLKIYCILSGHIQTNTTSGCTWFNVDLS